MTELKKGCYFRIPVSAFSDCIIQHESSVRNAKILIFFPCLHRAKYIIFHYIKTRYNVLGAIYLHQIARIILVPVYYIAALQS